MRICIKLVQTLMLPGQSVCISGSISSKDIKTTLCLKRCGAGLCVHLCACILKMPPIKSFLEISVMAMLLERLKLVLKKKADIYKITHRKKRVWEIRSINAGAVRRKKEEDDADYSMMVR